MNEAIPGKGLSKRFAGAQAVDRLPFAVKPGEPFGLPGPDGAGDMRPGAARHPTGVALSGVIHRNLGGRRIA